MEMHRILIQYVSTASDKWLKNGYRQLFLSTTLWYMYHGRTFEQAKFPAYNHFLVNFELKVSHSIGYFDNMTRIDMVRMKSFFIEII